MTQQQDEQKQMLALETASGCNHDEVIEDWQDVDKGYFRCLMCDEWFVVGDGV
jgi:hypothetical protein